MVHLVDCPNGISAEVLAARNKCSPILAKEQLKLAEEFGKGLKNTISHRNFRFSILKLTFRVNGPKSIRKFN